MKMKDKIEWFETMVRTALYRCLIVLLFLISLLLLADDVDMLLLYPDLNSTISHEGSVIDSLDVIFAIDELKSELIEGLYIETTFWDSLSYEGDVLYYFVDKDKIMLTGNARIFYGSQIISADSISIDFERNQAIAVGRIIMEDDDQLIIGSKAYYDIESETGIIIDGASRFELGFYGGEEIRKVGDEVFDVDRGRFTTCDAKHPHFDIRSHSMRIYQDHMVVGKPLIFYANDFPILALPFGAFSIRGGRVSGLLIPEPGWNRGDGKYFRNIGYFYAINDYADVTFSFDAMEKTGYNYVIMVGLTRNTFKECIHQIHVRMTGRSNTDTFIDCLSEQPLT
jgi:lipopolysaccharide assembly outer membrane protein LptD (OstA)